MLASRHRLLIVDDDPLLLEQVAIYLGGNGYAVYTARDGKDILQRIHDTPVDLVLLDITMPGPDGLEVLGQIRKEYSLLSLPVIMMTSHNSSHQIVNALEQGANDYLLKPLDIEVALARIHTQLTCKDLTVTKDEFLSIASHDLKKPLMLMEDVAQTLHDELASASPDIGQARQDLEYLVRTAHYMRNVVEGFLNQEALKSGAIKLYKQRVSPGDLINDIVQENAAYAGSKRIRLQVLCPDDLPDIEIDVQKINSVIDNLVGNAIKFSPTDTSVQVCARLECDQVQIEVVDGGPGLSDSDLAKLFIKYAQLSNKPTGNETSSGIGLSICRFMTEQHGGQIGARNNPDAGATFWISLPRADTHADREHRPMTVQGLKRTAS